MIIGIISDTHGLLRNEVFDAFQDVELILHAGDVGDESILTDLSSIAPVRAVFGNVDGFPLSHKLPETTVVEVEGIKILVTHIGDSPASMRRVHPEIAGVQAVVFGHSHRPLQETHEGVLYFNPGSAGPRRFSLPITVGLMQISGAQILSAQILPLL